MFVFIIILTVIVVLTGAIIAIPIMGQRKTTPPVLARDAEASGRTTRATGFEQASTKDLIQIMENYWDNLSGQQDPTTATSYERYTDSSNELATRSQEAAPWALNNLDHPEYEARESCAWLVGKYYADGAYKDDPEQTINALRGVINRPIVNDPKEVQAKDAALIALGNIDHPRSYEVLKQVLEASEDIHDDDTKWTAVEALEKLASQDFFQSDNPIQAATKWLREH